MLKPLFTDSIRSLNISGFSPENPEVEVSALRFLSSETSAFPGCETIINLLIEFKQTDRFTE